MMNTLEQAALALSAFPLSIVVKATVVLGMALVVLRWMRPAAASFSLSRPSTRGASPWSRERLLFVAWGVGAFVCLVPVLLTPWRLRQLRGGVRRWNHGDALARTLESALIARRVPVFLHDEDTAPLTCGIARPAILLPAAAEDWSDADIQQALVHELEHVRRGDWPVYVATRVVCALYWFHPLAWLIAGRLRIEAELACDVCVIDAGTEAREYAGHLLEIAYSLGGGRAPAVAIAMARPSHLEGRLLAVLDPDRPRHLTKITRTH